MLSEFVVATLVVVMELALTCGLLWCVRWMFCTNFANVATMKKLFKLH